MRQKKAKLDQAGIKIVLVGMGTPAESERFRQQFDVPFPLVCDPEKQLYGAYGIRRAGLRQLASPGLMLKGLLAVTEGHLPGAPRSDPMQMPGTFVIDQEGRFLLRYFAKDAADHVSAEVMIEIVRGGRGNVT